MTRKFKHNDCALREERLLLNLQVDLQSPDEATRARAVRALCPCHAGWQPFEQYMPLLAELQKDASPLVRSLAKHVFEDALEMESSGYPTNPREVSNEMLRTKRASRFPAELEEIAHKAHNRPHDRSRAGRDAK